VNSARDSAQPKNLTQQVFQQVIRDLARSLHYPFATATTGEQKTRTQDRESTSRGAWNNPNLWIWRTAMLVLTRKKSEMIRIGDNVVIKVISTGNGKVKIGIEAPEDVRVVRAELNPEPVATVPLVPTQALRDLVLARRRVATK
jgi:carbon storage regulator CsrA